MEARKLTEEEVDRLFNFCTKHYVPEYDLQVELVDHLASGIEEQWVNDPAIPFPVALNKTFDGFGIFGFSKIKSQKEKELRRKYRKLFWKFTLEFYKLPKVILTFALTFALFSLYLLVNNYLGVTLLILGLIIATNLFYLFWLYPRKHKINTTENKSFMLINYLKNRQTGINFFMQIPLQSGQWIEHFNFGYFNHQVILFFVSLAIVMLGILIYVFLFVMPVKIREHFTEQFPQFVKI